MSDRLVAQFAFLTEIDKLKSVLRASPLANGSRRENSGEHSWHIAMHALVLADHAGPDVSIDRVIRMLLVHDIVEIDAGDVPIHLDVDPAPQEAAERAAAARLFGLLPPDLGAELAALWEEFEAGETPDAAFARAVDRVQPLLLNLAAGGGTWIDYEVSLEQTETRAGAPIAQAAPRLWAHVRAMIAPWFERRG